MENQSRHPHGLARRQVKTRSHAEQILRRVSCAGPVPGFTDLIAVMRASAVLCDDEDVSARLRIIAGRAMLSIPFVPKESTAT